MTAADSRSHAGLPLAVIASGAERYADPWHPYPETSAAIAEVLRIDGWQVDVVHDPDRALTSIEHAALLVVNAGDPWRNVDAARGADAAAQAGLAAAMERGIGLLATHSALSSLRDYPAWRRAIGGEWQAGRSWHPPIGPATVRVVDRTHDIATHDISLFDERYSDLVVDPGVTVLAVHDLEGVTHPVVWAHVTGRVRAVVSALGHDARAYDSAEHRALLARAARWAGRFVT